MKPQEMWDAVRAKVSDDPRWLTTPAGLVAGLALTRALVPGRKRGPAAYGLGGAAGAAAGFGAGTLWRAEAQAPAREQAQKQVQALGKQNPLEVLKTHKPEEAVEAGRKALQLLHQDKGLDWFKGPLDPQEMALARLATEQSDKQPWAGGARTAAGAGIAGAVAPLGYNWWRHRGLLKAQQEAVNKKLGDTAFQEITVAPKKTLKVLQPATELARQVREAKKKLSGAFWSTLFPSAPGKLLGKTGPVRQMIVGGLAAGTSVAAAGGGAQLAGRATGGKSLTQHFNETRAWKMRAAHLEALQKFQQAQLSPDQQQALQDTLNYVRGQENASRASWWKQWLYPTSGIEAAEWKKR